MRISPLFAIPLVLFTGIYGCEKDCKVAMDHEFALRYVPVIKDSLTSLETELVTALQTDIHGNPKLREAIGQVVLKFHTELSSDLSNIMHHGIFDKYHARCQQIEVEGCPNYYCSEVCGSPGSIIYYLDDVLERTRAGVIDKMKIFTEENGEFEQEFDSQVKENYPTDHGPNEIVILKKTLRSQLVEFHQRVEDVCSTGCFKEWAPELIAKLQQYD
ncbi:hypothetical protein K7432_002924 [Basidiobolus ranarum]|uniref:Uncharacterized protein n=1 Tax=Basidiobolus ranarum TaxID=34480 RepID=A0ABR2X0T2_9FUNG